MNVTITRVDLHDTRASVDLDNDNESGRQFGHLEVVCTRQGRYRRVGAIWLPSGGGTVRLAKHYLDPATNEALEPIEAARRAPRRMWAHDLHGSDFRQMLEAGLVSYDHGVIASREEATPELPEELAAKVKTAMTDWSNDELVGNTLGDVAAYFNLLPEEDK